MGRKVKDAETRVNSVSTDCEGNPIKVIEYRKYKEVLVAWESGEEVWTTWRHFLDKSIKKPEIRLGTKHLCSAGEEVEVVEYKSSSEVKVRWEDGSEKTMTWSAITKGQIKKPFESRIGLRFLNKDGEKYEVISWINNRDVEVRWIEGGQTSTHQWSHVSRGGIRNPHRLVRGVGTASERFEGDEEIYGAWRRMLTRVYCEKFHERQPTYRFTKVSDELKDFSTFYKVYKGLVGYEEEGFCLDKDILSRYYELECPTYSAKTLCLVPRKINSLVIDRKERSGVEERDGRFFYPSYAGKRLGAYDNIESAREAYLLARKRDLEDTLSLYEDRLDSRVVEALRHWRF